jgi:hypothetical protein
MRRILAFAAFLCLAAPAAPALAVDLFAVDGVAVDVTAESANVARERALAQGRPIAWQRLFRKLTPPSAWPNQPQLDDAQLQRIVRTVDVADERRSTTRYLANVTYHFNQGEVQRILRQAGVAFTDTQARPVMVVPVIAGRGFDANSAWAKAWADPAVANGIVPIVVPDGNASVLSQGDPAARDWAAYSAMARRYNATEVVVATASPEGNNVQLTEIGPNGKGTSSLTLARSSLSYAAEAASQKIAESWKSRAAIDYSVRARLSTDVSFSPGEWPKIRSRLRQVRSVADMEIQGLALREARVTLVYFGKPDQLRDALSQQNLDFQMEGGSYLLHLGKLPDPAITP